MASNPDSAIPEIDLEPYLARGDASSCREVARAVQEIGVVILRDPRIPEGLPARMRELFLAYYRLPASVKRAHERVDRHHQIGWTPPFTESARERAEERARVPADHAPHPHPGRDPKERYSIPVGPAPSRTAFPEYNEKTGVVPDELPEWERLTSEWSDVMLAAVRTAVGMATRGFGCEDPDVFTRLLERGPHLLAPTGCDLEKYGTPGTVHAAFHTDMGFATIHGRSNHPGLFVWTRDLRRVPARLPDDGCLLLQVGKQWQICTGGAAHAGFHEVVATTETHERAVREIIAGSAPWRVSLTLFCHVASDLWLKPYDVFDTEDARAAYPPILAGARMKRQLLRSGLAPSAG